MKRETPREPASDGFQSVVPRKLSAREREVVRALITHGHQREAAEALGMSIHTLKNHMQVVSRKLGSSSALQVAIAVDRHDRVAELDELRVQYALGVVDQLSGQSPPSQVQAARAWVLAQAYRSPEAAAYAETRRAAQPGHESRAPAASVGTAESRAE